ncbi:MAG: hypothetical protein RL757_199 [Bacteroidota bacterium]|jgi:hypothetical protein
MKKLLFSIVFVCAAIFAHAQVPQSVCYQAVATDQQGRELVSQNIRARISVLKGSLAGTEEWVEIHNVTTDGFGLFDLPIGQGTRTGGAQTMFSAIKWGADRYFLKVEMDPAGGNSFVNMGTSQMLSVPYALYAEKANTAAFADSARIANRANTAAFADSSRTAGTSSFARFADSSRTAGTSSFARFSDSSRTAGTSSFARFSDSSRTAGTSTVSRFSDSSRVSNFALYAQNVINATTARQSDTARFAWLADSARRAGFAARANLADTATAAHRAVFAIAAQTATTATRATNADFATNATNATNAANATRANFADTATAAHRAQFAQNAQLAALATRATTADFATNATNATNAVNATRANFADTATAAHRAQFAQNAQVAVLANRATTADFATNATNATNAINATRANFADSATAANRAQFAQNAQIAALANRATAANFADSAGIARTARDDFDRDPTNEIQDLIFRNDTLFLTNPAAGNGGIRNAIVMNSLPFRAPGASIEFPLGIIGEAQLVTTNYTVPAGKALYVSAVNSNVELTDGRVLNSVPGMPIIPENTSIRTCYCTGILLPNQPYTTPIILDFTDLTFEYQVPPNKVLVIKSGATSGGRMDLGIDGLNFSFYTGALQSPRLITIPSGKRLRKPVSLLPGERFTLTGYLLSNN